MEENQKKIQDRLQLLGLLAPLILLLTLFCTLFKKTPLSAYLYISVIGALPAMWYYRLKGFLGSTLGLLTLFLIFYPFLASSDRLWHTGATVSLALGLFTVYMGFEELRGYIERLKVESKSRLDNLIDLDEEYNRAKETWKYEEATMQNELQQKQEALKREGEELNALEKLSLALRQELVLEQQSAQKLLSTVEDKSREISAIESKLTRLTEETRQTEQQLSRSQGERELDAIRTAEHLKGELEVKQDEIERLLDQIEDSKRVQTNLDDQVEKKEEAFRSMQEALRQKVATIQEQQEKLQLKEQDIQKQKEEIKELFETINQKEHEVLTVKSGLNERDFQIQKLNQKLRDATQDVSMARSKIEEKKLEIKNLETNRAHEVSRLEHATKAAEGQVAHHQQEINSQRRELEKKDDEIARLSQEKEGLIQTFEEKQAELEKIQEKEEELRQKQFAELKKLNDARFALYQASLDKERLKNQQPSNQSESKKHWLLQIEQLLRGERSKNINFTDLPADLSRELLTLNQTKALYKQLRNQFEEKQETLEQARRELYLQETHIKELEQKMETKEEYSEAELSLEKGLNEKSEEVQALEREVHILNGLVSELMKSESSLTR